jgi:hypothetical protein
MVMSDVRFLWQIQDLIQMVLSSSLRIRNRDISMASIRCLESINPPRSRIDINPARVLDGFDTLDLLEKEEVNKKHRPLREIRLQNVTIHANPLADESM